ncbi:hypothetical protein ACFY36_43885 [Actinoplanes sp. NPDC000266]
MEKQDRRPVSLAGLGLIGAGAVLGLALSGPATAAPSSSSSSPAASSASSSTTPPPSTAPKEEDES